MDENITIENQEGKKPEKEEEKSKSNLFDWAEALVISLAVLMLVLVFGVRVIGVDGISMVPTLQNGDRIVISNLFYTPEKGDIVVLTKKSFMPEPIVKRVIATAGDTVDVNYDIGEVTVNGEVLQEDYISGPVSRNNVGDMIFPQTVPEGCIFVMGDNRDHSTDSRVASLGMIDTRYVQGRILGRVYPFSAIGKVE